MQKISFFLLLISLSTCFAQHWSYGFQPGGKRNVENLRDSVQEIENDMDKTGELQPFECSVPRQHFTLRGLKGVLTVCQHRSCNSFTMLRKPLTISCLPNLNGQQSPSPEQHIAGYLAQVVPEARLVCSCPHP